MYVYVPAGPGDVSTGGGGQGSGVVGDVSVHSGFVTYTAHMCLGEGENPESTTNIVTTGISNIQFCLGTLNSIG